MKKRKFEIGIQTAARLTKIYGTPLSSEQAMGLTMADVGNAVSALQEAIDLTKELLDSHLPLNRAKWGEDDKQNSAEWRADIRAYRRSLRKFRRIELAALKGGAA